MAVRQTLVEEITRPSLMTFSYFIILFLIVASIVLDSVGFDVVAGLVAGFTVFLVALVLFSKLIISVLRKTG